MPSHEVADEEGSRGGAGWTGSPTGACEASYTCGGDAWAIDCDSEDDGTPQGLCTCYLGDSYVDSPLVAGTGEVACAAAAVSCIAR